MPIISPRFRSMTGSAHGAVCSWLVRLLKQLFTFTNIFILHNIAYVLFTCNPLCYVVWINNMHFKCIKVCVPCKYPCLTLIIFWIKFLKHYVFYFYLCLWTAMTEPYVIRTVKARLLVFSLSLMSHLKVRKKNRLRKQQQRTHS